MGNIRTPAGKTSPKTLLIYPPERIIEPYEMTLRKMKVAERKEWSNKVLEELRKYTDLKRDKFIFLCGTKYRQYLLSEICSYEIPMEGLRNGQQRHWLKEKLEHECVSRITPSAKGS